MLDKLTIANFQAHEKLVVEFDEHLTTIIGPNDVGKSAVLRALKWVCLNQPSGDEFIRHGSPVCWVRLSVDGRAIVRRRGDKINTYKLDGKEFRSFGVGAVPVDIAKVLQVVDMNFQGQIDPPFLFIESAGQVSKQLNQVINLGSIDDALSAASSELRRAHAEVEVTQGRLATARKDEERLKWVPDMESDLAHLEELQTDLSRTQKTVLELADLVTEGKSLTRRLKTLQNASQAGKTLVSLGTELEEIRQERKDLQNLLTQIKETTKLLKQPVPDITPLLALRKEADAVAESRRELEHFLDEVKQARRIKCRLEKQLELAKVELTEAQSRVPTCPYCGQTIPQPTS
jgi:exonuclease SbcC